MVTDIQLVSLQKGREVDLSSKGSEFVPNLGLLAMAYVEVV